MSAASVGGLGRVRWGSVVAFLVLAFGLSWAAFLGLRPFGVPLVVRAGLGMYGPLVAAVVTRLILREGFRDMGLRPWARKGWTLSSYVWAYVLPIAFAVAAVTIALVIGYQHWDLAANWNRTITELTRNLPSAQAYAIRGRSTVLFTVQVAQMLTIGPLVNCALTLGEELGWRGHLLPRLAPLGGPPAALLVGIVRGVWHGPLIVVDGYEFGIREWWAVPFFCLFTVPLAVIIAWLRFRSGSIWPGVLHHAMINALAGVPLLALSQAASPLIGPPVGLIGCIPLWLVAIWLVATARVRARASTP